MLKKAQTLQPWLTEIYRSLHKIPELGRELPETIAFVSAKLDEMDIAHRPCAGGILAELPAGDGKPIVALRADMDALPVDEETDLPWASTHAGKMHACGHDAHTTCALGALKLLSGETSRAATLRVLFQPDEEDRGGAKLMIDDGALDGVISSLGLHVAPAYETGKIAALAGRTRAASDTFSVTLHGRGCHGAYPHLGIDTIVGGSQIIGALQSIVSRETDPLDSVALTVGHFEAGRAGNVIPDCAKFNGILRTMTPQKRGECRARLCEMITSVARAFRLRAEIAITPSYPPVINDVAETNFVRETTAALLGAENFVTPPPQMSVDDFAYIAECVPGCYAELGCRAPKQDEQPLHSPRFSPDENCLPIGAAFTALWVQRR